MKTTKTYCMSYLPRFIDKRRRQSEEETKCRDPGLSERNDRHGGGDGWREGRKKFVKAY